MTKPDTPFPRHWLYYIVLEIAVIAGRGRDGAELLRALVRRMARERLYLFDTTLRDGAQTNGVDFTLADKLAIARHARRARHRLCRGRLSGRQSDRHRALLRDAQAQHHVHRLRHDAAAGPLGLERSGPRGAARGQGRRDLLRRQVLGLSRPRRARDHARGKPRLDPRQRAGRQRQGPRGAARLRALLRRLQGQSRTTRSPAPRPPTRRARAGWCCATPTAARCRTRSRRSSREVVQGDPRRSCRHPRPQRHRAGGGEFARRGARRRAPDPGHAQRARRALRQRQSRVDHPDAEAQAGVCRAVRDRRVATTQLKTLVARLARARRAAQPRAEPPRALCRRERLRHQGRHPCLRDREGPGDLRARRAGGGRQPAQGAGVGPGRQVERAGRARAHRPRGRQGRSARRPPARRGEGARGDRLCLRGGGCLVRTAGAAHARQGAELLRRRRYFDVNVEQRNNARRRARHASRWRW